MTHLFTTFFLICIVTQPLFAAKVTVDAPCDDAPWLETELTGAGNTVGSVTVDALATSGIPFDGSESGIRSIRNTVTGDAAMEVISDTEMRAYGWCFSINGVSPDNMPDEVIISSDADLIHWYFGYAHFRDGAWVSYCTPTNETRPSYICD